MPVDFRIGNPDRVRDELLPGLAGLISGGKAQREHKRQQRESESRHPDRLILFARDQQGKEETDAGDGDHQVEQIHWALLTDQLPRRSPWLLRP